MNEINEPVEATRLLTEKLDRLINFLEVCPKCVRTQLESSLTAKGRGERHRATDTWSPELMHYCPDKSCGYSLSKLNPNYVPPEIVGNESLAKPIKPEEADAQFEDLFG